MTQFTVPDMTCSGCVKAITTAIQRIDPTASVQADLASHRVDIQSTKPPADLAAAIDGAGFTAEAA